jgi:signal transduction histidine kinase
VIAALSVVLLATGFLVNALFRVETDRDLNALLNDHVQLARQLAQRGIGPAGLIARIDVDQVRAELVLPNGTSYGSLTAADLNGSGSLERRATLGGPGPVRGGTLTVTIAGPAREAPGRTLFRILLFTVLGALVVTAITVFVTVKYALAPLDAMTSLARAIARGGRGRRLSPARTDTELGRTAAAFDDMLDALEGAEHQARVSADRMKRFVADAAHELRTPVAGVRAIAETIMSQPPDTGTDERDRMNLLLVRESIRVGKLVEDLLDMARIDAGIDLSIEPVELRALAVAQTQRARLLHQDLNFEVRGGELTVPADPGRITQILSNLVDNACRVTPKGGEIAIEIGWVDEFAEVIVTDTGPGVPREHRERIFDRMVRLDEARERDGAGKHGGSGLGLAIARGIAQAHGGWLSCEAPGPGEHGAVFRLLLPLYQPAAM